VDRKEQSENENARQNETIDTIQNVEVKKEPINKRKKRRMHTVEVRGRFGKQQKLSLE
jgi:hypothetical protein